MKRMSEVTSIRRWDDKSIVSDAKAKEIPLHTLIYEYNGPMFFAGADKILDFAIENDTRSMILRMGGVTSIDASAMENLEFLNSSCKKQNVWLIFSHVREQPMSVMKKAGFIKAVGLENFVPDIDDALRLAKNEAEKQ